jgi:hypothetical protein
MGAIDQFMSVTVLSISEIFEHSRIEDSLKEGVLNNTLTSTKQEVHSPEIMMKAINSGELYYSVFKRLLARCHTFHEV